MLRNLAIAGILSVSLHAQNGPLKESSSPAFMEHVMPAFYDGYLYTIRPSYAVTLFASDGRPLLKVPLVSKDVSIRSVAVDSDKSLALSGEEEAGSGTLVLFVPVRLLTRFVIH